MKSRQALSLARRILLAFAAGALLAPCALGAQDFKVLHYFGGANDGAGPTGPLLIDDKGRLYGNTGGGGGTGCEGYGCGTIFVLAPGAGGEWKETLLYDQFPGGDGGGDPYGNLVSPGEPEPTLYGTMEGEGEFAAINEYAVVSGTVTLTPIYDQNFSPGLTLDRVGNIYGGIGPGDLGSGAIGELSPGADGWTYTQLYSFCSPQGGCPDGDETEYPLSWDSRGNLYGTTLYGGNATYPYCPGSLGCGVAFQMTPNPDGTWAYHVMHRFASSQYDGQYPDGGLALDSAGNAYGVAGEGGPNATGTIFELTPSFSQTGERWNQSVLYDFPNCNEGCFPGTTMVFDKAGNLYGIASGGIADCGGYTCGVVFRLSPQPGGKWNYTVLHKFVGTDGQFPWGVTLDDKGNLLGTTKAGGTYNAGVAFEISP